MNTGRANLNPIINEDIHAIIHAVGDWQNIQNTNVLITGASGFIASYIVEVLLALNTTKESNLHVYALARSRDKFWKRFSHHQQNKHLTLIHSDVSADYREKLPKNLAYVIHAASNASPKYYGSDPVGTLKANTAGTAGLLEICHEYHVKKFLYISSSEVYGQPSKTPTGETDFGPVDPMMVRSCYAESKRMGENMCISWQQQYSVPVNILRPFHTYGPGMDLNDGRVYADFIKNVIHHEPIQLNSNGLSQRAFCYLKDAVEGIFQVLLKGADGHAYNLGNDKEEISILKLAEKLQSMYPQQVEKVVVNAPPSQQGYIQSHVDRICPDIKKINKLGWNPKTTLEEGFARTIKSYDYETP